MPVPTVIRVVPEALHCSRSATSSGLNLAWVFSNAKIKASIYWENYTLVILPLFASILTCDIYSLMPSASCPRNFSLRSLTPKALDFASSILCWASDTCCKTRSPLACLSRKLSNSWICFKVSALSSSYSAGENESSFLISSRSLNWESNLSS